MIDNKVPGPQKYDSKALINGNGFIFNSKFSSNLGITISGKHNLVKSKLNSNLNIMKIKLIILIILLIIGLIFDINIEIIVKIKLIFYY
jgi:hypothetical protein